MLNVVEANFVTGIRGVTSNGRSFMVPKTSSFPTEKGAQNWCNCQVTKYRNKGWIKVDPVGNEDYTFDESIKLYNGQTGEIRYVGYFEDALPED